MSANLAVILREQPIVAVARDTNAPKGYIIGKGPRGEKGDPGGNIMAIGLFTDAPGLSIPLGTDIVRTSGHSVTGRGVADYVDDGTVDAAYVTAHPRSSFISANGRGFRLAVAGEVNAMRLGAVGDGAADDKGPLNESAALCRETGAALVVPAVPSNYQVTGTVDFSEIRVIDARGALIQGTFSGQPAAIIGSAATIMADAHIHLKVQNTPDFSTVDGTYGIKVLGIRDSQLWLFARGFDVGLYFDGVSANRNWVGVEVNVLELYNNGSHVHFDLAGTSYAVRPRFIGGRWYFSAGTKAARGMIKITQVGSTQASEIIVESPQISIYGPALAADQALLVYASLNTTINGNSVFFKNARLEIDGALASIPYMVNMATTTSGSMEVDAEFVSIGGPASNPTAIPIVYGGWRIEAGDLKTNNVYIRNLSCLSPNSGLQRQILRPASPAVPYQTSDGIYVPGRVIFNNDYTTPAAVWTVGTGSSRTSRANGDGQLIASSGSAAYGQKFSKTVGFGTFLRLNQSAPIVVICYDASGTVLSGTAPYYAKMRNSRSTTLTGSVGGYQGEGDWVYIHPNVASFFIGASAWIGVRSLPDIEFEVTYGDPLTRLRDNITARDNIVAISAIQSYLPVGASFNGTATNGWRNTFYLSTTSSGAAASGATTINATVATGITAGDRIGIEVDTVLTGSERQFFHTTVSSIAGSTITLAAALPASVASGRRILVNRWVAR